MNWYKESQEMNWADIAFKKELISEKQWLNIHHYKFKDLDHLRDYLDNPDGYFVCEHCLRMEPIDNMNVIRGNLVGGDDEYICREGFKEREESGAIIEKDYEYYFNPEYK